MFDLVTVGHFAIDLILTPEITTPTPTLGGPPTYVSLAAKKLGAKVSVVSKVGEDFHLEYAMWLKDNGVDLSGLKQVRGALTTRFNLKYDREGRHLQLMSRGPPIVLRDILPFVQAKAFHVAPIVNEVSQRLIRKLRKMTNTLSLDPQGLLRRFSPEGNVSLKKWKNLQVLKHIDVYKSSVEEVRAVTGIEDVQSAMKKIHEQGVRVVVVTKGKQGSTLFFEGSFFDVPACTPKSFKDATGAGDTFTGAFLAEYIQGKSAVWCACVGSAAASFAVEGVGAKKLGEKEEVYSRADKIFDF